jgi:hypothetical protein
LLPPAERLAPFMNKRLYLVLAAVSLFLDVIIRSISEMTEKYLSVLLSVSHVSYNHDGYLIQTASAHYILLAVTGFFALIALGSCVCEYVNARKN